MEFLEAVRQFVYTVSMLIMLSYQQTRWFIEGKVEHGSLRYCYKSFGDFNEKGTSN